MWLSRISGYLIWKLHNHAVTSLCILFFKKASFIWKVLTCKCSFNYTHASVVLIIIHYYMLQNKLILLQTTRRWEHGALRSNFASTAKWTALSIVLDQLKSKHGSLWPRAVINSLSAKSCFAPPTQRRA